MTKKKTQQELLAEVNKNDQIKNPGTDYGKAMTDFEKSLQAPLDYKKQLRVAKEQQKQALHAKQDELSEQEWSKMLDAADKLLHSGQQGYDSWVSAMSSIVQTSEQRNKALLSLSTLRILTDDVPSLLLDLSIFITSSALTVAGAPINLAAKMAGSGVEWRDLQPMLDSGLKQMIGYFTTLGEDKLPGVKYLVEFDADNKMVIKNLVRQNYKKTLNPLNTKDAVTAIAHGNTEQDFERTQILAFQAMVVTFLAEKHGCVPDPANPGQFKNKDGVTLKQGILNQYLDGRPGTGLMTYLTSKLNGMDIEQLPSPRP